MNENQEKILKKHDRVTSFYCNVWRNDLARIEEKCKLNNLSYSEFGRYAIHYVLNMLENNTYKPYIKTMEEVEKEHIFKTLKMCNNNKTYTAKKLNIGRRTLIRKLQSWGIE